jgi:hypothetical protein
LIGVGPFGGIVPLGYTSSVSFGGAPRFFPGAAYGEGAYGGAVRGAVYRREIPRRGLRAAAAAAAAAASEEAFATCETSIWDIVRSDPALSALHALLANDIPWVAASLDGKTNREAADFEASFPPGEPYDSENPNLIPLLDDETGARHVDTLFAPNDAAVEALRSYLLGEDAADETREDAEGDDAEDVAAARTKRSAALEALGAGNATRATMFLAYHVSPDARLALPKLRRGQVLKTALGDPWRLMIDIAPRPSSEDDSYRDGETEDGDEGEVVVGAVGSRAGIVGGGRDACNGRVFIIDHVLLPVDVDGVTTPEQEKRAEAIRRVLDAEHAEAEGPIAAEAEARNE